MVDINNLTMTSNHDGLLFELSKLDNIDEIKSSLKPYYDELVKFYEDELIEIEGDFRSGDDTYGYSDLESIKYTLTYISDRWKVSFRVRWLIDLINPKYCLYNKN